MSNYLNLRTKTKGLIRVVIDTPRGAAVKLAYDPDTRVFEYSRPLPVGTTYPYDWGFIPSTLGDDGDPLDGLVIHQASTAPSVVIKCDLLGAISVKQRTRMATPCATIALSSVRTNRMLPMSRLANAFPIICAWRSSNSF
jgi:inorganic pyrophosphatase